MLAGGSFIRSYSQPLSLLLTWSANVFLHIAVRESFGNVYVEALGSGGPIVAHDDEVTPRILEAHAYLVDSTSNEVVVDALRTVLRAASRSTAK